MLGKKLVVCATAAIVGLMLCAASWSAVPTTPSGKVVIGSTSEIIYLDPLPNTFVNDVNVLYANLYDTLFVRRADGGLGPNLAESWRLVSPTEWEFKLRRGVKFQNGEPFNAAAVKVNVDRYLQPGKFPRAPHIAKPIKSATVVDEYTVRIATPQPDPAFLENTLVWLYFVPPGYYKSVGEEGTAQHPIGTGPFKFVEWVKGSHVLLDANLDYWKGRPKFKTLEIRLIPEIATRVAALRAGEIDIAMQLTPDQIPAVEADRNLRASSAAIPRSIYLIIWTQSPGQGNEPLKDQRVRQALNYAINTDSIIKNILYGQATRIATIVPPLAFGYDPSIRPYAYDPAKAKQLLTEAGYGKGFTVDLDVPTGGNPLKPVEVGEAIAADLARVGITAHLRTLEAASYITFRNERKVAPIFLWNWNGFDAHIMLWGNAHPDFPFSFYHNPAVIKLIDEEGSMLDPQQRRPILARIQKIMVADGAFVGLYQQNEIYGVNRRIDWSAKPGGQVLLWDTGFVKQ